MDFLKSTFTLFSILPWEKLQKKPQEHWKNAKKSQSETLAFHLDCEKVGTCFCIETWLQCTTPQKTSWQSETLDEKAILQKKD